MSNRYAVSLVVLSIWGIGCTSAADRAEQIADPVIVKPTGGDSPGSVFFKLPDGAAGAEQTTFSSGSRRASFGESLGPLPAGWSGVLVETLGPTFSLSYVDRVFVGAGQSSTVTVSLVGVNAQGGPPTVGVGGVFTSTLETNAHKIGTIAPGANGTQAFPLVHSGGQYEINYGIGQVDGVSFSPVDGTTMVNLTDFATRRVTRLRGPQRDLPSATCGSSPNAEAWLVSTTVAGASGWLWAPGGGQEIDLGVSLRNEGAQYYLASRSWRAPILLPIGERGAGPLVFELGRVDVADVSINGGSSTVKGTYQIFPALPDGSRATEQPWLRCSPETGTGVDVPPGHYRVEVTYTTVEAGVTTDSFVVDTP